ncbi:hypothetical protein CVV70_11960 [Ralstonia solanacearum]|nr:hypothetical protein CVS51_08915 [Ralstonia solanacearum]PNQ37546.1 hypothetical protein CVV71_08750 [Ralstonia solanacearum]PNQ45240.1 hypothetical protein CVT21_02370 [Ralstonia solanacearum]PNQ45857.1 hypothetical protein CVT22_07050 [Ralstonia solanacearum]PNQ49428.1 hypothetical protein CVV70_11960 [Ralstonia solanacearum]
MLLLLLLGLGGASLVSSPAGADLLSLSCQRKSAKKGAPDAATPSLNFCDGEGKGANSLRSDRPPSFFLPVTKIQGAA